MSDPSDADQPSAPLGSMKTITDAKLVNFTLGQQKKTRFQKMRDAKEAKEREDAEEAALVYQSFAASFTGDEDNSKAFVRSSSSGNGSGGAVYKVSKTMEMDRLLAEMKERDAAREAASSTNTKGQRQIDVLLNEMKSNSGSDTKDSHSKSTSKSDEDLTTTNIFLASLAPSVTERLLYAHFSQFGALNSIKIMWPRNEDERARNRNTGFVSFRRRVDAEAAMMELQDTDFHGFRMAMHWGKPVPMNQETLESTSLGGNSTLYSPSPPAPFPSNPPYAAGYYPPMPSYSGFDDNYHHPGSNYSSYEYGAAQPVFRPPPPLTARPPVLPAVAPSKSLSEVTDRELSGMTVDSLLDSVRRTVDPEAVQPVTTVGTAAAVIRIQLPRDILIKGVIDSTAKAVAAGGQLQENVIKNQMYHVPHYEFLRAIESEDWWYYQWRTYAFRNGEDESAWSLQPCQLTPGGPTLYPPPFPGSEHLGHAADRHRDTEPSNGGNSSSSSSRKRGNFSEGDGSEANYHSSSSSSSSSSSGGTSADKYASMTGAQIERERNKKRSMQLARLNNRDYCEWRRILSQLTLSRSSIKEAMGFAFDKIESSEEIVSMIRDCLILPSDRAAKIAGLYLLSDILHNAGSSVKQAAHYRGVVQGVLPEVMEDLAGLLRRTKGRMSAFQIEDRVRKVLSVWADWSIFPTLFLLGLQAMFYFSEAEYTAMQQCIDKSSSDAAAAVSESEVELLRKKARATGIAFSEKTSSAELQYRLDFIERYSKNALSSLGGGVGTAGVMSDVLDHNDPTAADAAAVKGSAEPLPVTEDEEDIDGVPLHPSVVGSGTVTSEACDDIDGVPLDDMDRPLAEEDIDGVPLQDTVAAEEDIDGVPMDDIDGVPLEGEDIDGVPL